MEDFGILHVLLKTETEIEKLGLTSPAFQLILVHLPSKNVIQQKGTVVLPPLNTEKNMN